MIKNNQYPDGTCRTMRVDRLQLAAWLRSTATLRINEKQIGERDGDTHAIRLGGITYWFDVRVVNGLVSKGLLKSRLEPYTVGLASGAGTKQIFDKATWLEVLAAIKAGAEPLSYGE
jgi:hypothetical protein